MSSKPVTAQSQQFFGYQISDEQKKIAERVRALVNKNIGSWQHYLAKAEDEDLDLAERKRLNALTTRGLPIQWVKGDADKAESSFFKINTKGTPLDDIEELLLKTRKKPISVAARAIIRAGKGHRYWSSFDKNIADKIEQQAKELHSALFDPEINRPIKTLDLPLGGPKGIRAALQALMDLTLIATRNQQGMPKAIADTEDDVDGSGTVAALKKTLNLVRRVTGNECGSLGLHPAVYFYGPTGRHSGAMFMGTMALIGRKLANNDGAFFHKFTQARSRLEDILVGKKDLIATILQKHVSSKRIEKYADFLDKLVKYLAVDDDVSDSMLVEMAGLEGKIVVGSSLNVGQTFSEDIKSQAFINLALNTAIKCPICNGYLDAEKSVSYDHVVRAREGGAGSVANCHLTHPYCNQAEKN